MSWRSGGDEGDSDGGRGDRDERGDVTGVALVLDDAKDDTEGGGDRSTGGRDEGGTRGEGKGRRDEYGGDDDGGGGDGGGGE